MSYAVHVFTTITFILFLRKLKCNPLPTVAQVVSGRVTVLNKKKTLGKDVEISNSIGRGFQEMISKDVKDRIERIRAVKLYILWRTTGDEPCEGILG